jgi:transglutaminase-like putative cysteine protease
MEATVGTPPLALRVGCAFTYEISAPTPAVFVVRPIGGGGVRYLAERWETTPTAAWHDYRDAYGNECRRVTLPPEPFELTYDAVVETSAELDPLVPDAIRHDVGDLPDEALVFTLPSRFCLSDVLAPRAHELFSRYTGGWEIVQAICDFVHGHITFGYGSSSPTTSALDVYRSGNGVCRDFAHLAITFCRAMNVPARYAFGYLPDIDVPPPGLPMDFCAWFEAYLGGRWYAFDPRNNERRKGRVPIARGRDALDVAMVTTYGSASFKGMTVWADRVEDGARSLA